MAEHVDLIREAVALIRKQAADVPAGPWDFHPEDPRPHFAVQARGHGPVATVYEASERPLIASYIVSWHPGVALAIADLLDGAADREETWLSDLGPANLDLAAEIGREEGEEVTLAIRIACVYLGREVPDA